MPQRVIVRISMFFAILASASVVGCGGSGTSSPVPGAGAPSTGVTASPNPSPAATSGAVAPNSTNSLTTPATNGVMGTLSLVTGSTWPSGVSATITATSSGAPIAQSAQRKTLAAAATSTWKIAFSGSTATANLSVPPSVVFSGLANPSSLIVELFDATAGAPPLLFTYNVSTGAFVATGTQFQLPLGDTFYLEIVSGSTLGASPTPTASALASTSPSPTPSGSASPSPGPTATSSAVAGTLLAFFPQPADAVGEQPAAIVTGPDGNLWIMGAEGRVGKMTTAGTFTEFSAPHAENSMSIAVGSDGNLWFPEANTGEIARITTSGTITEFSDVNNELNVPPAISFSAGGNGIATGSDGNLWVTGQARTPTNAGFHAIARFNTNGVLTGTFAIPNSSTFTPGAIVAGPDGNLWFTSSDLGQIGMITVSGVVTIYPFVVTNTEGQPFPIVAGPDGNLWFAEHINNQIGKITTSGAVTEYPLGFAGNPQAITSGPDGNLWVADVQHSVSRITTSGVVTEFPTPITDGDPLAIVTGPDGNLWVTFGAAGTGAVGKILP
jgi:streptogramin lyase